MKGGAGNMKYTIFRKKPRPKSKIAYVTELVRVHLLRPESRVQVSMKKKKQ